MINTKSLSFIAIRRQLEDTGTATVATMSIYITKYLDALEDCGIDASVEYIGRSTWKLKLNSDKNPDRSVATKAK